jgi:hypothetical protein
MHIAALKEGHCDVTWHIKQSVILLLFLGLILVNIIKARLFNISVKNCNWGFCFFIFINGFGGNVK